MYPYLTPSLRAQAGPRRRLAASIVAATDNRLQGEILRGLLRGMGADVCVAPSAAEAHRLIDALRPATAVLATDLPDESGWLTCAKLRRSHPWTQVILLGANAPRQRRFAEFVGAAVLLPDVDAVAHWLQTR